MTDIDKMTIDELWTEAEMWLDSIGRMVKGRCYQEHSSTGIQHIKYNVRRHLVHIDRLLLEIDVRDAATKT